MSIEQGNKLIAEFMGGWTKEPEIENYYWNDDGSGCSTYNMKYHSSWDWLMPVVEKIWKMGKLVCINYYDDAGAVECKIYNWGLGDPEHEFENADPITAVWQAVVQFIQWYNTQAPSHLNK